MATAITRAEARAAQRQDRAIKGIVKTLDSAHPATRVTIEAHPTADDLYNIAIPIGDEASGHREQGVKLLIAVKPDQPHRWQLATQEKIQSSIADAAGSQQPIANAFTDFFTDYHSRSARHAYNLQNDPESRKHYELQSLGSFAPTSRVLECCWQFPSVPVRALGIDYKRFDDGVMVRPVYVRGPKGHLWPGDFGRGQTSHYREHPSGDHSKDVYVVAKPEIPGWVTEKPKYTGVLWQVPDWMVARFGPYGVKSIDLDKDTVEFYREGESTLASSISEIRDRKALGDANLEEIRRRQRLALYDLMEDYPVYLAALLEDEQISGTKAYMERLEAEEASEREAQLKNQTGVPAAAAAQERVNSELFSPDVWKSSAQRVRQSHNIAKANLKADPRDYAITYSSK